MTAYYNEIDPFAAAWLRALISAGHIAPGDVDTRSIVDVRPDDLRSYTQCHFFAGIGVWSYALRRAGWSDDRPIWTGSCPCQPFSAAGKGGGFDDERHLWPHFHYLIAECGPPVVAGEQVASKDGLGWLDLVQADLEGTGYAFGAIDTCSAGFGAPHIRQRLWWLGERLDNSASSRRIGPVGNTERAARHETRLRLSGTGSEIDRLDDDDDDAGLEGQRGGHQEALGHGSRSLRPASTPGELGGLVDTYGRYASAEWEQRGGQQRQQQGDSRDVVGVADVQSAGRQERDRDASWSGERSRAQAMEQQPRRGGILGASERTCPTNGFWRDPDWLFCRDGKWRPVEPGTFPLAHGAPARVGRLRGYGNAINAEAATSFIEAYLETKAIDADRHIRLTTLSDFTTNTDQQEGIFG
jgi:DNA (cytosine-5)-methyltransferase 1